MKNILLITAVLFTSVLSQVVLSEEREAPEKGANMQIFKQPDNDLSKSARPAKPELLEPSYRAKITSDAVTLKWSSVATASAYHLQVATDPNFKWLLVNEELSLIHI